METAAFCSFDFTNDQAETAPGVPDGVVAPDASFIVVNPGVEVTTIESVEFDGECARAEIVDPAQTGADAGPTEVVLEPEQFARVFIRRTASSCQGDLLIASDGYVVGGDELRVTIRWLPE